MNPQVGYYQGSNMQNSEGCGCPDTSFPPPGTRYASPQNGCGYRSRTARQYGRCPKNCDPLAQQTPCKMPPPTLPNKVQLNQSSPNYCTPQAVKINISADQVLNAKKTPVFPDRIEPCDQGNMKYIQLNWKDLIGGMDNLRVTMAPSCDPNTPNQELHVSFGGQRTDPPIARENPLKVFSTFPAQTAGRMPLGEGNAYAGYMRVCEPTNMRMPPCPPGGCNPYAGGSYWQPVKAKGFCRR